MRVDERDTMFARMARRPGTPAYGEYYRRHPERQRSDDRLRAHPPLLSPGGRYYDPVLSPEAIRLFDEIEEMKPDSGQVVRWARRLEASTDRDTTSRSMLLEGGAVAAGVTEIDPAWVYTRKGRFDQEYGEPVNLTHPRALVFLVEMEHAAMRRAPGVETIVESARRYHQAALLALTASAALREGGWQARAHYDAHYDLMLPPLAEAAGLGELGRNNILVADRFGSRVRIGAVTTDLPLRSDAPIDLGVRRFCAHCRKCADNCPPRALSVDEPIEVRGVVKWPTEIERCYGYWRTIGTDCGICMACCPFSHPDSALHHLVRRVVRHLPLLHRPLKWLDDVVYGRRWRPTGDCGTTAPSRRGSAAPRS